MNSPITIIAECGINHNGDIKIAKDMVTQAKQASADAAKFQMFTGAARPRGTKYIFNKEQWEEIAEHGRKEGIKVFWSVFDFESAITASSITDWVKLSFVERRNSRLIELCDNIFGRKIVSVDLYSQYGRDLADWEKLYCPNNGWSGFYPTKEEDIDWPRYAKKISEGEIVGWSCHCVDWYEAIVAASLGATIIEKHFKVTDNCPDAECSLDSERFKLMVRMVRSIYLKNSSIKIYSAPHYLPV